MKAYKGFNEDMTCRDFQFEEGKTYTEEKAELCASGFHACLDPLDCFLYYSPSQSVFHEVDLDDVSDERQVDSKVCAKKIKIGAKLDIAKICNLHFEYVKENGSPSDLASSTGNCSAVSNTGDSSATINTGDYSATSSTGSCSATINTGDLSVASNTGDLSATSSTGKGSAAISTGDYSVAGCTGDYSIVSSTGNHSTASNTGDGSAAISTGDLSVASNTGDYSVASSTGFRSAASVSGKGSVALATRKGCKAKANIGSAIVLCEYGKWDGEAYPLIAIKSAIVDGKEIKENTFYKLVNGEFVECD